MSSREAFGPNLRRIRLQRGLSLQQIASDTKIPVDLWKGLEENDFHRWPTGIYARAYVRSYAEAIGVDADDTVDEFCRWFTQGDRRVARTMREQAVIVGHDNLVWGDEAGGRTVERRASGGTPPRQLSTAERIGVWVGRAIAVSERVARGDVFHDLLKRRDPAVPQTKRQREI